LSPPELRLASTADFYAHSNALLVHAMKPYMTIFICGYPQFLQSTIWTFLHDTMEVKTVLNLEADTRGLCQDTITYPKKVSDYDDQEVFYSVFFEMDQE